MRIISGKKRGATIIAPRGDKTRPTSDRARQAIFNLLDGGRFDISLSGAVVADLFAGTGAMGLEAWSRGAKQVILIDNASSAMAVIKHNITHLEASEFCHLRGFDLTRKFAWSFPAATIVFLDPPWRNHETTSDRTMLALGNLHAMGGIAKGAVIGLSYNYRYPPATEAAWNGFSILDQRRWGRSGFMLLSYDG